MSQNIVILGGGVIGRVAKLLFPEATVLDAAPREPSRSSFSMGVKYLHRDIPELDCRRVPVYTFIDEDIATEASAAAYKAKIGKDSDVGQPDWFDQFEHETIGWAFHTPLLDIKFGNRVKHIDWKEQHVVCDRVVKPYKDAVFPYDVLISTIPLPILAGAAKMPPFDEKNGKDKVEHDPVFRCRPIWVQEMDTREHGLAHLDQWPNDGSIRVYYHSDPNDPIYRSCLMGYRAQAESLSAPEENDPHIKVFKIGFGKIWQSDFERACVRDLEEKNIHCFGRFGAWNPDELTHNSYQRLKVLRDSLTKPVA